MRWTIGIVAGLLTVVVVNLLFLHLALSNPDDVVHSYITTDR